MLLINNFIDTNIYMFIYMFIYNLSLISIFWSITSFITIKFKTLYTLSELTQNSFLILNISILLFSMAGVPPFIGFFSKIFVMVLVLNSYYFLFYTIFIVLLFLGLYFYMQNLRFLHSTNLKNTYSHNLYNERSSTFFYYYTINLLIFIVFGLIYIDDLVLFFTWIFY